jgi:hypothetical protein
VILFSCDPNDKLPKELILEYAGCQYFGNDKQVDSISLQVRFQKGDGNLGLDGRDTIWPYVGKYNNNLFVYVFDKVSLTDTIYELIQFRSGQTSEMKDLIYTFRVPTFDSRTAPVKGVFGIGFGGVDFSEMQKDSRHGIVRFEIYMYDRDLVQSNIVTTPDIHIQ